MNDFPAVAFVGGEKLMTGGASALTTTVDKALDLSLIESVTVRFALYEPAVV